MPNGEQIIPDRYFPEKLKESDEKVKDRESDLWLYDGMLDIFGHSTYSHEFALFLRELDCEDFLDLTKRIKRLHGSIHILDAMGGGYFIQPEDYEHIDSMTELRLANVDDDHLADLEEEVEKPVNLNLVPKIRLTQQKVRELQDVDKRHGVYGSVYDKETWSNLSQDMSDHDIPSYDLIICRPMGPFSNSHLTNERMSTNPIELPARELLKYAVLFDNLFCELMERVNDNHGMLFLSIPTLFSEKEEWVRKWVNKKKKQFNVEITLDKYCRRIFVKH